MIHTITNKWTIYLAVDARGREGSRVLRYGVETDVRHVEVESLGLVLAAEPHHSSVIGGGAGEEGGGGGGYTD